MKPKNPGKGTGVAFGVAITTIVLLVLFVVAGVSRGWFGFIQETPHQLAEVRDGEQADQEGSDGSPDTSPGIDKEGFVEIGGVLRPKSDLEGADASGDDPADSSALPKVGSTPLVDPDSSPQARSVAEAFKQPDLSYRLSVAQPAPKFDREAFEKNPDAYLNEIAPGRIFDVLPSQEGNTLILRRSPYRTKVLQGESVVLRAETEPGMPVTFYSPRLGAFDDGLTSITVRADQDGVATVAFKATTGTYGEIDIVAASPVRSGRARYLVDVRLPDSNR